MWIKHVLVLVYLLGFLHLPPLLVYEGELQKGGGEAGVQVEGLLVILLRAGVIPLFEVELSEEVVTLFVVRVELRYPPEPDFRAVVIPRLGVHDAEEEE